MSRQRDTWRKLCGLAGAGQGRKKELLGVTGGLLTYQCLQTCEQKLKGTRIEALAQQCWKPHMMVPFMPDLGVVCFPAD